MNDDTTRAGRWATSDQRSARRDAILDAALGVLQDRGYDGASMQRIAQAARTSKETLYGWFGDKPGLFQALVEREAAAMNDQLTASLTDDEGDPRTVLVRFGTDVLTLLLGPRSIAINRAAIASAGSTAELGAILAAKGRESTRPLVERVIERAHERGALEAPDTGEAFELLMGLLVRDLQIRVLFGGAPRPAPAEIDRRARVAVDAFWRLHTPPPA